MDNYWIEYFTEWLKDQGLWEEFSSNEFFIRQGWQHCDGIGIVHSIYWRHTKQGPMFWEEKCLEWDTLVMSTNLIKSTKIAKKVHKGNIIKDFGDKLLIRS